MPSLTLHLSKAPKGSAARFLSTNPVDVDIFDTLRRWASDAAGRQFEIVAHATTFAVATIHFRSDDSAAPAQLLQRLAVLGIEAGHRRS